MSFLCKTLLLFCLALTAGTDAVQTAGLVHLPRTGQTAIYAEGDDGDIQAGVVWPDPRFTVNGDCVTDNLTGLMWGKSSSTDMSWASALTNPKSLNLCGHQDWRLPNINELESLVHLGEMFPGAWLNSQGFSIASAIYWSSTSAAYDPALARGIDLGNGDSRPYSKSSINVHIVLPVRGTTANGARVWQTGQTQCYDSSGAKLLSCAGTGQDGEFQAGVVWPASRFAVSGNCVTDNLTGMMWIKTPESTSRTWQDALSYSNGLSLCGYGDWRLPNRSELLSLVNYDPANNITWLNGQGFSNVRDLYWSSTTYADNTPVMAWRVNMGGGPGGYSKAGSYFVWPVRGGDIFPQSDATPPVDLPRTGQKTCSDALGVVSSCLNTGQDGDFLAGVSWPDPRFTVDGSCVTDNLTGLIWTKNANIGGTRTWQGALDGVAQLNGLPGGWCGYTDWRLSNLNELESLVNVGASNPNSWLTAQGFTNVQAWMYWTSTTYAASTDYAWIVKMDTGQIFGYVDAAINKTSQLYVWPVRGRNTGPAKLWKTGQTTSYASRDDGDLERGVAWPSQRFTISGSCVIDNLTTLTWARTPDSTSRTWLDALTYANGRNLCGYKDWRLPNRTELRSLVNYEYPPSNWLNEPAQGFSGVINGAYWTSTSKTSSSAFAWFVSMEDGLLNYFSKTANATVVWPVRGGSFVRPLYLPVICR